MVEIEKQDIPKKIKKPSALDDLPLDVDTRFDDWENELIDRPDGMSVDEFLKKNNVTELQYNALFQPEKLPEGFEDRIVQRGGSYTNLITVREGVTSDELRKAIELVAEKTPHQSVKEFIYSQYETFDNIKNKIPGPVAEKTLNNINKDIAGVLFDSSDIIYDPKGGGRPSELEYGNKVNQTFMPMIDKGVDETVIEKAVLKEFIPDYGADQLPAPGWAEQKIGNALRMAQEDLTIEGQVIPDTPQLDKPTNVAEDFETVKNNIANDLDKKFNMKGAGLKIFDVIGKVAGPVDEVLLGTLNKGIPTLFKNTALAGVAARMSPMLGKALVYLTLANLGVGAIRGSMTFAKEYGGDTSKAIDAILSGEIPEKTFSEAMKESLSEGFAEFGDQMQYDPFYMLVDKTVLQPLTGGKDQGYIMEKGMEYGSKGIAGIKNLFGSK